MVETKNEPVAGDVIDTEWVSMAELIVTVESDGETWKESYTFNEGWRVESES